MGLAPRVVDEIFEFLARLAAGGASLLLVEQYVTKALALADYVYLLHRGEVASSASPASWTGRICSPVPGTHRLIRHRLRRERHVHQRVSHTTCCVTTCPGRGTPPRGVPLRAGEPGPAPGRYPAVRSHGRGDEILPGPPCRSATSAERVAVRRRPGPGRPAVFVFLDAQIARPVGEIGQGQHDLMSRQVQAPVAAAATARRRLLARRGVSATTVRPDPGPGQLVVRAAGDQESPAGVEDVAGEGEVVRRVHAWIVALSATPHGVPSGSSRTTCSADPLCSIVRSPTALMHTPTLRHDLAGLLLDPGEVFGPGETLGVDLVDVLGARRARGEPPESVVTFSPRSARRCRAR